ncbi:MAG: type ISP restriction/modification enzyme, partial [Candidatus Gracilibacteria bacterium]|jgi:predicted helicase
MSKIRATISKHETGQDPVIHFYEPFLAEYDPKEREARGVYYTPKPVVDYIVKSVDWILREKFGKKAGIEDREVYLLDPATGTGTFLMSAVELIHENKTRQFGLLGEEIVEKEFIRVAENHILKHFFGFELMIAPYAISHLKLTMLLEEFGFDFSLTKNDNDPDNDRLKIYLANTLDEPLKYEDSSQKQLDFDEFTFYQHVSHESRDASEVKSDKPVMAIVGNPPYSGHSSNNGDWIRGLVKDYYFVDGEPLGERNTKWLQDDYVKFIRFAQWKINKTGEGVIGYITNHSYLDNPTFRGMRQQLMKNFNEIYILDLHGNSLKKETTPEGGKDENVFNIQTGVSIVFLIKHKDQEGCKIYRSDIFGAKNKKTDWLGKNTIETTKYAEIEPQKEFYLFKKQDGNAGEYDNFYKVNEIFKTNSVGIVSSRDDLVIDFDKEKLKERIDLLTDENISDQELIDEFKIKEKKNWKLRVVRKTLQQDNNLEDYYREILYRPFDKRSIFYDKAMLERAREEVMRHMGYGNIGLIVNRQIRTKDITQMFICENLMDLHILETANASANILPLFLYSDEIKSSNINEGFIQKISEETNQTFKLDQIIQIFDYIYGILYLPQYREKYAEQLKIDFPRIPLPSQVAGAEILSENIKDSKEIFEKISTFGNKLRNLHLLTDPVFEDQSKWNLKIGGIKSMDTDDWKVTKVEYKQSEKRVYVNDSQYFEGIEPEVWKYYVGGYQVLDKWLKDRKKAERCLSLDDLMHYMKIVISLRETIRETERFK